MLLFSGIILVISGLIEITTDTTFFGQKVEKLNKEKNKEQKKANDEVTADKELEKQKDEKK